MRKRAKTYKVFCNRGERRHAAEERGGRGGGGPGGKIRGRAGRTEGERTDVVTVGGGGSGCVLAAQPVGNKQASVRQTALSLMGEKLAVPWMFPCTFHFLNAVLSVHHLTSHQCLRREPRFICCCT